MGEHVGGEWDGGVRTEDGGREGAVDGLCSTFFIDGKCSWLQRSSDLHCSGLFLMLEWKSTYRQYVNKWAWLLP